MDDFESIVVLGAGAIGSSVGADLTAAGLDVTIVDQWPGQVDAMQASGLTIDMPDRTVRTPVVAHHVHEMAEINRTFDLALLTVKSYDTRWMTELVRPHLHEGGALVAMQNGMNDDDVVDIVGRERAVSCVVELSAQIYEPGTVQRNTTHAGTWFGIGEHDNRVTPRIEAIRDILSNVARTDVVENILAAKWTKLIANSMIMAPCALVGLTNWEVMPLPGVFDLSVELGKEAFLVGQAAGLPMQPVFGMAPEDLEGDTDEVLQGIARTLLDHTGKHSVSAPIQDHRKGRRSELAFITGVVVRKGAEHGVPTPYSAALLDFDQQIDRGERQMSSDNIAELLARI